MCRSFAEWARLLPHLASGMVRKEAFGCEKVPVTVFQDSDDLSRDVAHHIAALIAHKAEAGELAMSTSRLSRVQSWPAHWFSVFILHLYVYTVCIASNQMACTCMSAGAQSACD